MSKDHLLIEASRLRKEHEQKLDKLRAVLTPAIEAAKERNEGKGLMNVYLVTSCKALLQAAELLEGGEG